MIPAASRRAPSPPGAIELDGVPETQAVVAQRVRRQVTDLQARELTLELLERHPDRKGRDHNNQPTQAESA